MAYMATGRWEEEHNIFFNRFCGRILPHRRFGIYFWPTFSAYRLRGVDR